MSDLLKYYLKTRHRTSDLCKDLNSEDYNVQGAEFTSPPKWHLAHTTWFFEEMILKHFLQDYKLFDEGFAFLFNSYYNHLGDRLLRKNRGLLSRPEVASVLSYRNYVDEHIIKLFEKNPSEEVLQLLFLGTQHEQQHQELLISDLKYSFSLNPSYPIYQKETNFIHSKNQSSGWIKIPDGIYEIGHKGKGFSFDNENNQHKVYLQAFEISKSLVSNGDYIEFIEANGYKNFNFWLDEGWAWINDEKIHSPLYWHKKEDGWWHYTMSGLQKIDSEDVLCHISYYEAMAFATWKGQRLATEFEWEAAADEIAWGSRWEWTNSAYLPYPGFNIAEGAVGEYNGKFMSNQMVLRGASSATSEGHSRKTYRNFFHPHLRWQFSGIRLVK